MEVQSSDFSDVFVSYRRKDVEFTKQLVEALQAAGKECWIDWEDIPPGSVGFSDDIKRGLEGADAFIAVLTPDYLESPYCVDMELKYAVELKKKLIPVVLKKFDGYDIPADISHINWIYFTPHAGHENTFEESIPKVLQSLDTDLEHVRTHKRLLLRALEWDNNERKPAYLMRGNALAEAETWLAAAADKVPPPTELHGQFILESRKAATAQQRQLLTLAGVAVVVMAILSVFAVWQWREAERNKDIAEANEQLALRNAEESRSLALAANSQLNLNNNNLDLAVALALEGSQIEQPPQDTVLVLDESAHLSGTRRILSGHGDDVNAVVILPDDERALSASNDRTLMLWNILKGEQLAVFEGHDSAVTSVTLSLDGEQAFSCDLSGTVIVWDIAANAERNRFESEHGNCNDLQLMPDGESLLAAYADGTLILWEIESGAILRENNEHLNAVGALALSSDGSRYASAEKTHSAENPAQVIVWDTDTGEEIGRLDDIDGNIVDIDFSDDGQDIFVSLDSSGAGVIQRWNIENADVVQSLIGHTARTDVIRVFESGAVAISGAPDNTAILWKLDDSTELRPVWQYTGHGSAIYDADVTSDGQTLVTASADDTLRVWNVYNSAVTATGYGHDGFVGNTVLNGDATIGYSVGLDNQVRAWDTATGDERLFDADIAFDTMTGLYYNAPTNTLLVSNLTAQVVLIDADTAEVIYDLSGVHSNWVRSVTMTHDGQTGISVGIDGIVAFYNLADGSVIHHVMLENLTPSSVSVNHAGNVAAVGTFQGTVILLDLTTYEEISRIETPAQSWSMAYSTDDSQLAIAMGNSQIALYDTETLTLTRAFVGHSNTVNDVAFINDDEWLMSASDDNTVRVWRVADGVQVRRVTLFAPVYALDATSDGQTAMVGLDNGTVQFLNIPPYSVDELLDWVKNNRYIVDFSCDERRVYHLDMGTDCS